MKEEVKVGITITVAIILFIGMMVVLKNVSLYESGYRIIVQVNDAAGILKGDPVTIAGVQIGRVENIWLKNNQVYMQLWVNNKYKLSEDSRAFIKTLSVMGEKYVAIQPGLSKILLQEGDTIPGIAIGDVTEIAADAQPIILNLKKLIQQLQDVLNDTARQNIRQTLYHVQQLSQNLDKVVRQSGKSLDKSARNIAAFSQDLNLFSQQNKESVNSIVINLKESSREFASSSERLSRTIQNLEDITNKIKSWKGTMGRLVYDERLYQHLDSLLVNTNELIKDLQKNPHRYLKISLF